MALFPRYLTDGWDMFPELDRLQSEINRLFSHHFPGTEPDFPVLNVYGSDDDIIVTGELPGVDPNDLDISVVDTTLTLTLNRPALEPKEGETVHRRERSSGKFTRTLQLPFKVDRDRVEARLSKGVLQVRLPRVEAEKPRRINVASE